MSIQFLLYQHNLFQSNENPHDSIKFLSENSAAYKRCTFFVNIFESNTDNDL